MPAMGQCGERLDDAQVEQRDGESGFELDRAGQADEFRLKRICAARPTFGRMSLTGRSRCRAVANWSRSETPAYYIAKFQSEIAIGPSGSSRSRLMRAAAGHGPWKLERAILGNASKSPRRLFSGKHRDRHLRMALQYLDASLTLPKSRAGHPPNDRDPSL